MTRCVAYCHLCGNAGCDCGEGVSLCFFDDLGDLVRVERYEFDDTTAYEIEHLWSGVGARSEETN